MATVTTLRPSATVSSLGWTPSAGTLHGATSDNSDATYALWSGSGSGLILSTVSSSPPAGERRHQVRLRARGEDGDAWWAVRLVSGATVGAASAQFSASPGTVNGSWGFGAPPDGATMLSCYVTGQSPSVKINELYLDVDTRLAPTFTPQVLDSNGVADTSITDTATPGIRANLPDLDDLAARSYRYWVTSGATIVWDTGVVSGPAVTRATAPLPNGSYTAHYMLWSTLGANTAYASDEDTLAFTVAVNSITTPNPPTPAAVADTPFVDNNLCVGYADTFDGSVAWVELRRIDCNDVISSVGFAGPLMTDECQVLRDYTVPRTSLDGTCDHPEVECCVTYQARIVAFLDEAIQISGWSDPSYEMCLDWSDDAHLFRSADEDGPLWLAQGGQFTWDVDRPFTSAIGVNGTRFVTSATPGGRNLHLVTAVESETDLAALREILDRPLVLVSPSDSDEVWAAPVASSVKVIKVGRIRQVTADFIATGPEPSYEANDLVNDFDYWGPYSLLGEDYGAGDTWLSIINQRPYEEWPTDGVVFQVIAATERWDVLGATPRGSVSQFDGTFEDGFSGYGFQLSGFTATDDNTRAHQGSYSLKLTVSGAPATAYVRTNHFDKYSPASPGQVLECSFHAWSATSVSVTAQITALNVSDAVISTQSAATVIPAATWTRVSVSFTMPALTTYFEFGAARTGSPGTGTIIWIDDLDCQRTDIDNGRQLFTVLRSRNGVSKSQTTGTRVVGA